MCTYIKYVTKNLATLESKLIVIYNYVLIFFSNINILI